MPPSLAELQRGLADVVLGRRDPGRLEGVAVPHGVDPASRIAVYVAGYPARVEESLREAYPAIEKILGEGAFHQLAMRYLDRLPPEVRNLNHAGVGLPAFLESDRITPELPFLPDLGRLEWAVFECLHGERVDRLDLAQLAGWGADEWANAHLELQPGVALVCSEWPLAALHGARHLERSAIDVDLVDRPDRVLVHRQAYGVVVESVDEIEATAVTAVRAGETLGAIAGLLAAAGAGPERVLQLFARWTGLGIVADCRPGASGSRPLAAPQDDGRAGRPSHPPRHLRPVRPPGSRRDDLLDRHGRKVLYSSSQSENRGCFGVEDEGQEMDDDRPQDGQRKRSRQHRGDAGRGEQDSASARGSGRLPGRNHQRS